MSTHREHLKPPPMRHVPLVWMYHSVDLRDRDPHQITVSPDRFRRQLGLLRERGLRGVSMTQLLRAHAVGRGGGLVGLTFDDGYADFSHQVLPELQRHGFTATVFVVAGRIGQVNVWDGGHAPLMAAGQVRSAAAAGMEIGSHGMYHRRLSQVEGVELDAEVQHSREVLRQVAGAEVVGFCYPYGDHDEAVAKVVRDAGYDYACATWHTGARERHRLPRTYVGERDSAARLGAKWLRHRLTWQVS